MHHYCVIWSKTESAADEVAARLEQFVHRRLIFEPDEVVLHGVGSQVIVFSASVNQAALGIESPCHLSEHGACLVGGLATFERFPEYAPSSRMRPAAWLDELLDRAEPQSLYLDLGGNYSVVRAGASGFTGFSAFSGYDSLFYLETEDYAAVGNRASLVAALQSAGPCAAADLEALSWIPATTQIIGHRSPWAEVRRVPTGHAIELDRGSIALRRFPTGSDTPPDPGDLPEARAAAIDGLVDRYRWYLSTGIRLEAHLTGGKDSRASLALLLAAGGADRLERVVTIGSEDNGDVVVARRIAESLGIAHEVSGRAQGRARGGRLGGPPRLVRVLAVAVRPVPDSLGRPRVDRGRGLAGCRPDGRWRRGDPRGPGPRGGLRSARGCAGLVRGLVRAPQPA